MKTRSVKSKKIVQSDRGDSSTSTSLDENLWGTLQHHIDLAENIYSKLPFEEFFHLRAVCKDWYVFACKRLGLKEPIHMPFFCLFSKSEDNQLGGILIYNALSRSWDWRAWPNWTYNPSFDFVASKGVVFSADRRSLGNHASVFHWQSKKYQLLDPPPTPPSTNEAMIWGMTVSDKQGPFSLFRVVRGSLHFDTQVYESGVWQSKPCCVPKPKRGAALQASTGCVDCNGRVYITTEHTREIFVYDFEESRWSSLFSPGDSVSHLPQHYCLDMLGAWNSRIFDVTCDFESGRRKKWSIQVWELVDEALHKWKVYDCMPKGLCSWLRSTGDFPYPLNSEESGEISMQASFCGDFLLVYSWDFLNGYAERFCLFNMATKNWQKLNIAAKTVVIREEYPTDPYDSDNSDDSFDIYAYSDDSSELYGPLEWSLDDFIVMKDEDDDDDSDSG